MDRYEHIVYGKYHVIESPHNFENDFVIKGDHSVIFPQDLQDACLTIAKELAPYDTGNLTEAIHVKSGMNKAKEFSIVYPFREANYLYALEFGNSRSTKHVGFIRNTTVGILVSMIEGYFNDNMDFSHFSYSMTTLFMKIASKKGFGSHRETIGKSRYSLADTQNRLQRRSKSISQYNKMFYYKRKDKPIQEDNVYKMHRMGMDFQDRDRRRRG